MLIKFYETKLPFTASGSGHQELHELSHLYVLFITDAKSSIRAASHTSSGMVELADVIEGSLGIHAAHCDGNVVKRDCIASVAAKFAKR